MFYPNVTIRERSANYADRSDYAERRSQRTE